MPPRSPFDGKPLRVTVGTRPLADAQWLVFDDRCADDMADKAVQLAERHDEVVAHRAEGDLASAELLDLVVCHLAQYGGDRFAIEGSRVRDLELGTVVDTGAWHPIDAAGRLVQEDLTIMTRDAAGDWRLSAASVCSPSRWKLADKMGADLGQIHRPVPFYEERIGAAVRQGFDRMEPGSLVWRLNWTLLDDPTRFQATSRPWGPVSGDFGASLFFRVERQTLRVLPRSRAIAFTIRTTIDPLSSLMDIPDAYHLLANTLERTDPRTIAYKGWTSIHHDLIEWLRANRRD